ncbi:histidine kinase [Carboxylicivirga sp. A043]|uniref:sensor histidine kinase n=1 Tax=Carboxylicivirga litoralis TaxID=2816963 RepID=UPI0021CB1E4D|nr:histidine kinase [Carboxylicivirga sp. A043]MCU4157442.1 histidine kinase [Carboxylicivirga sp. A043]
MKPKILLILFMLTSVLLFSQNSPYRLYDTHNGLPQIQVTAIFQDLHGYIWVGTKAGLAQFNGEHFHHFLPNEHIYSIANNKEGNLYVKATKGLYKYDGTHFQLVYESDALFHVNISFEDIFIYSKNWIKQFRSDSLVHTYKVCTNMPLGEIKTMVYDAENKQLYCTGSVSDDVFKLSENSCDRVYTAPDGWRINTVQLKQELPAIAIYKGGEIRILSLLEQRPLFTYWVQDNEVQNIEVYHLPVKQYLYSYMYDYFILDSLTNSSRKLELDYIKGPFPVMEDKDNNLWVGSDNGLYQVWERPFKTFPRSFMNDFWTFILGDDRQLYGAAYKQGLYRLNLDKQEKQELIAPGPFGEKERDYYYGASKDNKGNLYFPSHYGLVKYSNGHTKKLIRDICLISAYDSLSQQIVFGKQNGLGFIDGNSKLNYAMDKSQSLVKSHPSALVFTDSTIWVGTGKSLAVYYRNNQSYRHVSSSGGAGPKGGIISMCKDVVGNIWLGGREGLFVYQSAINAFKKVDISYSGFITALMVADEKLLLIGTTREVLVVKYKDFLQNGELQVKTYNFRNGLTAQEIAQNSFIQWQDNILFPSTTNTTLLNLKELQFDSEFFDVAITHFNSQPIAYALRGDLGAIQLNGGQNDLEFKFETIGFGLPTKPVYRFRLLGHDKEWTTWNQQNYANFYNLPSGHYTFEVEVKPAIISRQITIKTARQHIAIDMPFYKEPKFYQTAFFILLVLAMVVAYIARSRYRFKVKAIEQERKKRYLEVASLQANLNPHFIFNLLASVQNLITQHQPEKANQYLIKFSRLIRAYMEATIKSSKVADQHMSENEISIKEEIDLLTMYIDFEQVKYRGKAFDYEIQLSDDDLLNRMIPPMVLQPFVENAIKHGLYPSDIPGKLEIRFLGNTDKLVCVIKDNGIGRKQSMKLKEDSIQAYESRGLELINKRVEILNELGYRIEISYEDPMEGGTKVVIVFN